VRRTDGTQRIGAPPAGASPAFPATRNPQPATHHPVTPSPRHPVTLMALLCATLLLGGCTAAPSVVAPAAPGAESVLVPAASEGAAPEPLPADETANVATSADTVGYSQTLPAVAAPRPESAPIVQTVANRPPPPPDPGTGQSVLVEGGSNGRLEVALTFDAGADTGYGAGILDVLGEEGISATFGMTGLWAQANPDLVQRMVSEGHQLINHTWDHASLTGANTGLPAQTPDEITQQLADTEAVVRDLTGYETRPYFRPPYGDYDAASLGYLADNGYYLSIWWTCDSHGWDGWGAQEIIDYCTTNIAEDEILLLHVGASAAGDFEALPGLIQFFRDSGYAFVTVEQMLQP